MNKLKYLAAILLLLSAVAEAAEVDDLIARGAELRKGATWRSFETFERAHARAPSGRTLAQMGLAEFSLQRYVDAEAHLAAALATDTPWITKNRQPLEQALQSVRSHTALVAVVGTAGADVTMNGSPIGRLPLSEPLRVPAGKFHFEATAAGHRAATFDISAAEGTLSQVTLDLPPLVLPPPPPLPPPSPSPSPSVSEPPELVAAPGPRKSPVEAPGPNWSRWSGIGLLALSAAAITTGIVLLASDNNGTCNLPAQGSPEARCMRVYDTRVSGWIAIGGGAAAAGGGLLLWRSSGATDLRLDVAAASLAVSGKF